MTKPLHNSAALAQFEVENGCLQVGGISLPRLVQRVGRTPFYAYDRRLLTERVRHLRTYLPPDAHLHYAIKANPMPAVVQHMATLVDGLDVASAQELRVALDTPIDPPHISFAGPGKTDDELTSAIASGIIINLESEREMETTARLGDSLGIQPKVAVRINPDFELKTSGMRMGGGPKQFGVDAEHVPVVLQRIGKIGLDFQGFHIFSGSQNLSADAIAEAQEKALALAIKLADHAPSPVHLVNIGGGFGIPYFPGDEPLDVRRIGEKLGELLPLARNHFPEAEFIIELGRYLVGEAGVYVCRVLERKISRGHIFLITDGGLHHHLAASGNFGQVIRKNYPVAIGNKLGSEQREEVSVVGPLCTPLDLLADRMDMARAEAGDMVVIFQSGAYGLTASPTMFLSHPAPVEVLV